MLDFCGLYRLFFYCRNAKINYNIGYMVLGARHKNVAFFFFVASKDGNSLLNHKKNMSEPVVCKKNIKPCTNRM